MFFKKKIFNISIYIMFIFLLFSLNAKIYAFDKGDQIWKSRIPISLNGIIQPVDTLRVQSSVGGRVISVKVKENDQVIKDQILLILKNETQRQQLKLAELQLKINKNNLEDSKEQINLSKIKLDTTKNSVKDSERQLKLFEFQVKTSINNIKDRQRQVKLSELKLQTSRNNLKDRQRQVFIAETQINISANSVKDQETNLKDIDRRLKDEHTLFEQGSSTKSQLDAVQLQKDRGLLSLANAKLNLLRSEQDLNGANIAIENTKNEVLRSEQDLEGAILAVENSQIALLKAKQDVEGGKIAYENAKLSLKVAEKELTRTILASENKILSLKLSEQEVQIRKDSLEDTYIKSKIDGIVVSKIVEEGEMIGAGTDLFNIINIDEIEVVVEVKETDLPNISVNQPVVFTTPSYPEKYFKAKIERISWISNPETGLFPVYANGDNIEQLLRLGMSSKIYLVHN